MLQEPNHRDEVMWEGLLGLAGGWRKFLTFQRRAKQCSLQWLPARSIAESAPSNGHGCALSNASHQQCLITCIHWAAPAAKIIGCH